LGQYSRTRPFKFSFAPRCWGLLVSVKYRDTAARVTKSGSVANAARQRSGRHHRHRRHGFGRFFAWATATFKLQERRGPIHRTYTSALVCEFDKEVESGLGKLSEVKRLLSVALAEAYGWKYESSLFRLAFNVDPTAIPHLRNTTFILERRVQYQYSENRYFSAAPLKTAQHISLLETIERELLAK
jgi:hypothetical protein